MNKNLYYIAMIIFSLVQLYFAVKAEMAGDYPKAIYEMIWMLCFAHLADRHEKEKADG